MTSSIAAYSMTGFARAEGALAGGRLTIEAKSVNHRYLDFKFHLPRELSSLEQKMAELARSSFQRGRIEVWVNFLPGGRPVQVVWNRPLAQGIISAFQEMKQALALEGNPDLALLASQKDVILIADSGAFGEDSWIELAPIFTACFQALQKMRGKEGATLVEDIIGRIGFIEDRLARLSGKAPLVVAAYQEKLGKRISELLSGQGGLDKDRLAQEAAIFADRGDVTEELVRAKSHLAQFRSVLDQAGPKGRQLDFLIQEIFREFNTLSNKAQDADMSALAVEVKTELEKIREQVQNLE